MVAPLLERAGCPVASRARCSVHRMTSRPSLRMHVSVDAAGRTRWSTWCICWWCSRSWPYRSGTCWSQIGPTPAAIVITVRRAAGAGDGRRAAACAGLRAGNRGSVHLCAHAARAAAVGERRVRRRLAVGRAAGYRAGDPGPAHRSARTGSPGRARAVRAAARVDRSAPSTRPRTRTTPKPACIYWGWSRTGSSTCCTWCARYVAIVVPLVGALSASNLSWLTTVVYLVFAAITGWLLYRVWRHAGAAGLGTAHSAPPEPSPTLEPTPATA